MQHPRPEDLKNPAVVIAFSGWNSILRLTSVFNSLNSLLRRCLEVMYLPSLPVRGESFTIKFIEMVGSEIFWKGIASGFSTDVFALIHVAKDSPNAVAS